MTSEEMQVEVKKALRECWNKVEEILKEYTYAKRTNQKSPERTPKK